MRWRHRADSSRLLHELRNLAHQSPAPVAPISSQRAGAAVFSIAVQEALQSCDGSLRYSKRLDLLDEAQRLGINRFEANLVIALCQNHRAEAARPGSTSSWLPTLACIALVQMFVVWLAWRILL